MAGESIGNSDSPQTARRHNWPSRYSASSITMLIRRSSYEVNNPNHPGIEASPNTSSLWRGSDLHMDLELSPATPRAKRACRSHLATTPLHAQMRARSKLAEMQKEPNRTREFTEQELGEVGAQALGGVVIVGWGCAWCTCPGRGRAAAIGRPPPIALSYPGLSRS